MWLAEVETLEVLILEAIAASEMHDVRFVTKASMELKHTLCSTGRVIFCTDLETFLRNERMSIREKCGTLLGAGSFVLEVEGRSISK
jgi:hypothetical protein